MAVLVLDPYAEEAMIAERKAKGIDQYDEVWEGTYVMSPLADDEHQDLVGELYRICCAAVPRPGFDKIRPGVNVSDRNKEWTSNFRVPDVAVFLSGTQSINRGTHWQGGPDFAVEITSEGDRSRDKLPFYSKVGVRELLIVDRDPWQLELYRLKDGQLTSVGQCRLEHPAALASEVLPLSFRLIAAEGQPRPRIEVSRLGAAEVWKV